MSDHLVTIGAMYAAFGRGDIPFIIDQLADDVVWEYLETAASEAGVPWLMTRTGRVGALDFFGIIKGWTFHEFTVKDIMASEQRVAAIAVVEATLPNGYRFRDEEMHVWTFGADGKIVEFRHVTDTAKHVAAIRA